MNKKIKLVVKTVILSFFFSLCGCDSTDSSTIANQKQIPVYQGMTISNSTDYQANVISNLKKRNNNGSSKEKEDDNGNHYGWYKGDSTDNAEEINQEDPFPGNEKIDDVAKSTLEVIDTDKDIYYANVNQDVYITIHLSNPDAFEIMSFTLNDKKYSSYMFEEGSDLENLILKYNVGDNRGIQQYTIDAIKYIDGSEIKDVIIDGDKTVTAGIKVDNQVLTTISDTKIGSNSYSFKASISDKDGLINFSEGKINAVLYDGESIIDTKELTVGENEVSFDNLKTNSVYQYEILASYDDFSGNGIALNALYKEAFCTKPVVLFDDITISQDSLDFSYKWYFESEITELTLYYGDETTSIDVDKTKIEGLLSNNEYKLEAKYDNNGSSESISLEFATASKNEPTISFTSMDSSKTTIDYTINSEDKDDVLKDISIELYNSNNELVGEATDELSGTFSELLSNNEYSVKVTYTYDLNDGDGDQTDFITKEITTLAKAEPSLSFESSSSDKTSITYSVSVTDADEIVNITKVELLKDGEAVKDNGTSLSDTFTELLSNNEYSVKVTYTYDLNDGKGAQTDSITKEITTKEKIAPYFNVSWVYSGTGVTYNVTWLEVESSTETDYDTVTLIKVELLTDTGKNPDEEEVVKTNDDSLSGEFTKPDSNANYGIKFTYTIDLNNGNKPDIMWAYYPNII